MAKIEGLSSLIGKFAAKKEAVGLSAAAIVGYTARYALFVHENLEMKWRGLSRDPRIRRIEQGGNASKARPRPRKREPKGAFWDPQQRATAKFLEQPFREMQAELHKTIADGLKAGQSMEQCVILAGLKLQRASMLLCPVDTGNMRASAFTRLENGGK